MSSVFGSLRAGTASALIVAALCGCGGSSATPSIAPPHVTPSTTPAQAPAAKATTRVVITIPGWSAANAKTRRPAYVSPSTQSITVAVDGGTATVENLEPSSPDCAGAGTNYPYTCTVPITATTGSHTFTFVTYDEPNAAGNELSANSVVQSIVTGQLNTIGVTLAGITAALQVDPAPGSTGITGNQVGLNFIGRQTQTLTIVPIDADGNAIVGPGAPALAVSVTGASAGSGIAIAANSGNANEFVLTSSDPGTATLAVAATPTSTLAGSGTSVSVPLSSLASITTLAGNPHGTEGFMDGSGTNALFSQPDGIAYDPVNGDAYLSDQGNCAIRQVTSAGAVTTIAGGGESTCGSGDGNGTAAQFDDPLGIAYDSANGDLYVADNANCAVRQVTLSGVVTTLAGSFADPCKTVDGTGTGAQFNGPTGIAYDSANGMLYVTEDNGCTVRAVTTTGVVTTLAGNGTCGYANGTGSAAEFNVPFGVAYDATDGNLYVGDSNNCAIRKVTIAGVVTTFAGGGPSACGSIDGSATTARLQAVGMLAYSAIDGNFYAPDAANCNVRMVMASGAVTTIAGGLPIPACGVYANGWGVAAALLGPAGIAYDSANGTLLFTDWSDAGTIDDGNAVRIIQP